MHLIAHIGNIPVEESLPFLVPIIALCVYGRHEARRRREALERLPEASAALDDDTVGRVLARWSAAGHRELSPEHVLVLYPPGPEGVTGAELAARIRRDPGTVEALLDELAELGYVEFESQRDNAERQAWLTVDGYDLVKSIEDALLAGSTVATQSKRQQHETNRAGS